jgi:glycosyltransferase involved in cell wall biosynthesis
MQRIVADEGTWLKVAMLTYSTRPRGGVVHALKLAERLSKRGVEVELYSLTRSDGQRSDKAYFRKVNAPYEIFEYRWSPDLLTRLERMIESYTRHLPRDADVYHAQDCVGATALARMKEQGLISAPIFRTIHHVDDFAEPRLYAFEKSAVAHADHRFVVSIYWQKVMKNEFGYDSTVTYNGLDLEDFDEIPKRRGRDPTVLFVGGLEPRKGLEYLLHAMEYVLEDMPAARMIAVAKTGFRGTDEWSWFTTLADRLGIKEHMDFRESVPQRTLLQFYADSDVVVLPSKTEGWGLSLMEAMACRKPVVASRAGGIPELVRDGVDGILVRPGDVRGLGDAILRLLRDPKLRGRMGRAGRIRVKQFSWDRTADVVLEAYEQALH